MILLTRRTFLGLCALTVGATVFLLLAAAAQHGRGPLARFARHPARRQLAASDAAAFCPAMTDQTTADDQGTMEAYQSIEAELTKGSLNRVSENAARIAEAFGGVNPSIAASARRLARARDVAAARREFERLTDLFSRRSDEPEGDDGVEEEEVSAGRSLEV